MAAIYTCTSKRLRTRRELLAQIFDALLYAGWEGVHCDIDIDECNVTEDVCQNGGVCVNTDGSYYCDCDGTGYEGNVFCRCCLSLV